MYKAKNWSNDAWCATLELTQIIKASLKQSSTCKIISLQGHPTWFLINKVNASSCWNVLLFHGGDRNDKYIYLIAQTHTHTHTHRERERERERERLWWQHTQCHQLPHSLFLTPSPLQLSMTWLHPISSAWGENIYNIWRGIWKTCVSFSIEANWDLKTPL